MLIIKHLQGGGYVTPNICYVEETDGIVMKPYVEPEKELITFTIDGVQYQAEEGMTWDEWAVSEYDANNLIYIDDIYGICKTPDRNGQMSQYILYTNNYVQVSKNDYIVNNKSYVFMGVGAGT